MGATARMGATAGLPRSAFDGSTLRLARVLSIDLAHNGQATEEQLSSVARAATERKAVVPLPARRAQRDCPNGSRPEGGSDQQTSSVTTRNCPDREITPVALNRR